MALWTKRTVYEERQQARNNENEVYSKRDREFAKAEMGVAVWQAGDGVLRGA